MCRIDRKGYLSKFGPSNVTADAEIEQEPYCHIIFGIKSRRYVYPIIYVVIPFVP